jgi:hypothetical protein
MRLSGGSVSHKFARLAVYPVTDDNPLGHGLHVEAVDIAHAPANVQLVDKH